jgi:hypothetical protein
MIPRRSWRLHHEAAGGDAAAAWLMCLLPVP